MELASHSPSMSDSCVENPQVGTGRWQRFLPGAHSNAEDKESATGLRSTVKSRVKHLMFYPVPEPTWTGLTETIQELSERLTSLMAGKSWDILNEQDAWFHDGHIVWHGRENDVVAARFRFVSMAVANLTEAFARRTTREKIDLTELLGRRSNALESVRGEEITRCRYRLGSVVVVDVYSRLPRIVRMGHPVSEGPEA